MGTMDRSTLFGIANPGYGAGYGTGRDEVMAELGPVVADLENAQRLLRQAELEKSELERKAALFQRRVTWLKQEWIGTMAVAREMREALHEMAKNSPDPKVRENADYWSREEVTSRRNRIAAETSPEDAERMLKTPM
ncbi:hypothetical protein E2P84_43710 [Burkholderia cepacia]|uniref:Uncharacterized protein n=1 Tax=Burkholderia cepacia TaxID=292 RepID=A0AAX2RQN3_BURCE|nr:hypothetical protein [Burkholderia cepacia]TES61339.1 hypothetical protein E2P84_43710 [Burkholderia cepacia]TET01719.1 hypothetical protein E3D36_16930 [Burkholderia cepacia]TEU47577.1 hypothetical protein E3D37_16360 [Burkholderia cepacia]TEU53449.1 hypothetical protein E3D38_11945 [Burkholderia cepacia]TEV02055.1 hypothetical protein E3D40_12875 [Burkholderia cepacia]